MSSIINQDIKIVKQKDLYNLESLRKFEDKCNKYFCSLGIYIFCNNINIRKERHPKCKIEIRDDCINLELYNWDESFYPCNYNSINISHIKQYYFNGNYLILVYENGVRIELRTTFYKNKDEDKSYIKKFYSSQVWRDLSKDILERDKYLCQICLENRAVESHHKISLLENWDRRHDLNNIIAVCKTCHGLTRKNDFFNIIK